MTNVELFPDRALRGRRLTWLEFYQLRPDRQPVAANDNRLIIGEVSLQISRLIDPS